MEVEAYGNNAPEKKNDEKLCMVVIMGVTGAGKSYFINKLAGREVTKEGSSLHACTQGCAMIPLEIGGTKVLVIDTPGFDEAKRSDSEILMEIAKVLSAQYQLGVELKGIIYLHRITDVRFTGSSVKTFEIFKKICGDKPLKNVMLVTSKWTPEVDEETGSQREGELRESFWAYMLDRGSNMGRFYGDRDSAVVLISQLLVKDSIILEIQHDLIDNHKQLNETTAGSYVSGGIEDLKAKYEQEIVSLEKLRQELLEEDRVRKRRIQKDLDKERVRIRDAETQQVSLRRRIGDEVQEVIGQKKSVLSKVVPFIPTVFDILGTFVGIPPGIFTAVGSWFLSVATS